MNDRARRALARAALGALVLAGCGSSHGFGPLLGEGTARAWFTLQPGAYRDYKVTELGVGVRYLRITVGLPETYFGRTVHPWVYGPVPGLVPDSVRVGLRQYFSYAPDGALWFHGAENGAAASVTEPPVRRLLADPGPAQAWTDTVLFTSYFPLGTPFLVDHEVFTSTTTPLATLPLPAGTFTALRSSALSVSLDNPMAGGRAAALLAQPGLAATPPADSLPPERGTWYAQGRGPVAIDWPSGPTDGFSNSVTFELMAWGFGALPPRRTVWEAGQAAVRMGPASDMAEGSSGSPQILSGLRTRSSP